jgi:hypothetical protein
MSLRYPSEQITLFPRTEEWDGPSYIVHTATGPRTLRLEDSEIADYTMITYHGREHTSTPLRHNWDMLALIEPSVSHGDIRILILWNDVILTNMQGI